MQSWFLGEERSKHVQNWTKSCELRSKLRGGIHVSAAELTVVGLWELMQRRGEDHFPSGYRKSEQQLSFIIWEM